MPLCRVCSSGLGSPLNDSFDLNTTQKFYRLGTLKWHRQQVENGTCDFCVLLLKASEFPGFDESAHIGVTRIPDGLVPSVGNDDNPLTGLNDPVIVPFVSSLQPNQPAVGKGRKLPKMVDGTRMKKWVDQCRTNANGSHDDCKQRFVWRTGADGHESGGLKVLRLVDVNKNCIAEYRRTKGVKPKDREYAVLSYVIGGAQLPAYSKEDMQDLTKDQSDTFKLDSLPQVYQDAISVTKTVGLQYLWIDSMCLLDKDQGTEEAKDYHHGLDNMDRIYEGARLTICAADHDSADGHLSALVGNDKIRKNALTGQTLRQLPGGQQWGLIRGVYSRLRETRYMNRGWTYQELVLSHRCLVFVDGMAYFRCRTSFYSEDTFWEDDDDNEPSPAISTTSDETPFLPQLDADRANDDPWAWYRESLQNFSWRAVRNDSDTIDAFTGILNRVTQSVDGSTLAGMPEAMLDMALIWYHRPDIARGLESTNGRIHRVKDNPSWSWAAWRNVPVSTWVPGKKPRDRRQWLENHGSTIEMWHSDDHGNGLEYVVTGGLPPVDTPAPVFTPGTDAHFLQLKTYISRDFNIEPGSMGSGEIQTRQGQLIGIVYIDGGRSSFGPVLALARLSHAPNGADGFDYGFGEVSNTKDGDDPTDVVTVKPRLSAKDHDLRWVLLLEGKSGSTYRRIGLGHIREQKLNYIQWSQHRQWIALY